MADRKELQKRKSRKRGLSGPPRKKQRYPPCTYGNKSNKIITTANAMEHEEENQEVIYISSSTSTCSDSDFHNEETNSTPTSKFMLPDASEEPKMSSIRTRSETLKYSNVGAFHNKVNWAEEMAVRKRWPINVAYKVEGPLVQNLNLRKLVSATLIEVMFFCKNVYSSTYGNKQKNENYRESYDLNPVTKHLLQGETSAQHEDGSHVGLNSGKRSAIENSLLSLPDSEDQDEKEMFLLSNINKMANPINSDHSYCKPESTPPIFTQTSDVEDDEEEFQLDEALNDLLLNTIILKGLVCGQSPQELITLLDNTQNLYFNDDM